MGQTAQLLVDGFAERRLAARRVWDSELVTQGPKIRFYAGAPLVASTGHRIGALCAPAHCLMANACCSSAA